METNINVDVQNNGIGLTDDQSKKKAVKYTSWIVNSVILICIMCLLYIGAAIAFVMSVGVGVLLGNFSQVSKGLLITFGIFSLILLVVMLVGFIFVILGHVRFSKILDKKGRCGINIFLWGIVVIFLGNIANSLSIYIYPPVDFSIPIFNIILIMVISIIVGIMNVVAFNKLQHSNSLNIKGRSGASMIKIGFILNLISSPLMLIPTESIILIGVISLAVYVLYIAGWWKIRNSFE